MFPIGSDLKYPNETATWGTLVALYQAANMELPTCKTQNLIKTRSRADSELCGELLLDRPALAKAELESSQNLQF